MIYLFIGLAAGMAIAAVTVLLACRFSSRLVLDPSGQKMHSLYGKVIVVTVDAPFTVRALELAVKLAGRDGMVETFYMIEVPLSRSMEVGLEVETARALQALEEASLVGRRLEKDFLPAYVKTRQAGKAILEHGEKKGFDLIVFDLLPGERLRRSYRKLAESLQEKAGCDVIVVT